MPGLAPRFVVLLVTFLAFATATGSATARTVQISAPGGGEVRALVIGINSYSSPGIATLKGAVADARDLEATLQAVGVTDLKVLIELQANRKNVIAAMDRLIDASKAGDLVIISFAGHGSQQPELVKGSESDGMDEIFLLSGFASKGSGTAERIIDDEINAWLIRLKGKGADVLFIADTCHGGGLPRRPDLRVAEEMTYRLALTGPIQDDELTPISKTTDARLTTADLPNVTFLAAVDKHSKAPEVVIPGNVTKRGALSYAVARTIEKGRGGNVSRAMLFGAARQIAYQYSNTQQTIYTEPSNERKALDKVVFKLKVSGEDDLVAGRPEIKLRIVGNAGGEKPNPVAGLTGVRIVADNEASDLTWDTSRGEVLNSAGDVIANCRTANELGPIVDRVAAADILSKLAERSPQTIRLTSGNRRFRSTDPPVAFQVDELSGKYLIMVDLAGDGTVQYLYPKLKQDQPLFSDPSFVFPLRVSGPFGADYFVAITSETRLLDLETRLSALHGSRAAGEAAAAILAVYRSYPGTRVGFAGLITIP
ncbi:MAG: caspase family protein [Bradyrhizobium sp.]|uniref:caspase family protein n=1 Tax=Bradyrhizobium sp. TaxID=376 RepID=UPI003D11B427